MTNLMSNIVPTFFRHFCGYLAFLPFFSTSVLLATPFISSLCAIFTPFR